MAGTILNVRLTVRSLADLLMLAARTYTAANDLTAAERLLRRAIELDAANVGAYSPLGQLLLPPAGC